MNTVAGLKIFLPELLTTDCRLSESSMRVAAVFNDSDFGDLKGFPGKEHRKGSARAWAKMPSDQVVAIDIVDPLSEQLSVRIVGRNVHMHSVLSDIPK